MNEIKDIIVALIAFAGGSGFWAYIIKRYESKSVISEREEREERMLIGLGHDRIMHLGTEYIIRGSITTSEYENLCKYLYEPYKNIGGNGSADRIMDSVRGLPLDDSKLTKKEKCNECTVNNNCKNKEV